MNGREMFTQTSAKQKNVNKWMNGREMFTQTNAKQKNAQMQVRQPTDGRKSRQTLAAQVAKSSWSRNGNNAKRD